jgi:VCBS repeat-containing protein
MRRTGKASETRKTTAVAGREPVSGKAGVDLPETDVLRMQAVLSRLRESGRALVDDAMALEPRILFDGAAAATLADAAGDAHHLREADADGAAQAEAQAEAGTAEPGERPADDAAVISALGELADMDVAGASSAAGEVLVFIDARVAEQDILRAGLPAEAEVFLIDAETDGLEQMAEVLADRKGVAAIHVLSHGRPGELLLGSTVIDAADLGQRHAESLSVIREALAEDGDLLIYACGFAAGEEGREAVAALAEATGADVAASDDATGASVLGGDWDLEVREGEIEAGILAFETWRHLLSALTISATSSPIVNGDGSVGTTAVWVNAGTVDGEPIDLKATVVALNSATLPFFGTLGDDPYFQLRGYGEATVKWEIFKSGTNQTVYAFGSPNFTIADIDGVNGQPFTRETVAPSLAGLTGYATETPSNVQIIIQDGKVLASGTQNQNGELTSAVTFSWNDVTSWEITYRMDLDQAGYQARFTHDGDGDVTFINPTTMLLLQIDLDGDDSTAAGQDYAGVFSEGGEAVPVMDADMGISQHAVLGTELHEAFVTLTNARAGDELLVNGSTAGSGTVNGIDYEIIEENGTLTVHFTGTATVADYEAALRSVSYRNGLAGSSLDLGTRVFEVKVRNTTSGTTSNIAQATITVQGRDTDGDGVPDARDLDDDNDGILDVDEGQPDFSDVERLFTLAGDATRLSATEVQLTPEANDKAGTVMSSAPISLAEDFSFSYEINLGNRDDNGADGIAFILHADPAGSSAVGEAGGSMGASGIRDGIYIEFDTFNNDPSRGDIADDHTQLRDTDNAFDDPAGALTTPFALPNLEDGAWHRVEVSWDAASSTLSWSIDGQVVGTYTDPDIINTRFGGSEYVHFGFSASTGGAINDQRVRNIAYSGTFRDTDGDGVIDALDRDSDNDGIPDLVEAGLSPSQDADMDGMADSEVTTDGVPIIANGGQGIVPVDSDGDGLADLVDLDSDNDGIPDAAEARPTAGYVSSTHTGNADNGGINDDGLHVPVDTDGDGTPDYLDTDSDNDGIADAEESGLAPGADGNGDGIGDGVGASYADPDGSVNVPAQDLANAVPGSEEADYRRENTPPVAVDDGPVALVEDVPAAGNVLDNDSDPDNDALAVVSFAIEGDARVYQAGETAVIPGVGSLVLEADGTWRFVPEANVNGPVPAVVYTISDGRGGTAAARLELSDIAPVNDAPQAVDDTAATDEDTPFSADAAAGLIRPNDTDVENDPLAIVAVNGDGAAVGETVSLPSGALVTVHPDGSWSYDPNGRFEYLAEGETATDSFTYTVSDGNGATDTATVTVTVRGVNDAPSLSADPDGSSGGLAGQYVVTFTENDPPVPLVDADAAIEDAEGRIASLTVRLNGQAGDRLVPPDPLPGGISLAAPDGLQLAAAGELEVTFTAGTGTTLADWNALLHQLGLEPSADTPENPDPADRTVVIEVVDEGGLRAQTSTLVHVVPVNDPPVVDLDADDSTALDVDHATLWVENGAGVSVGDADLAVTDVDDTVLHSAEIVLSNARPGDVLEVGPLPAGLVARVDTSFVGRIVVTLTGEATAAEYEQAIRGITFRNTTETPDETTRLISVRVSDGELDSGTAVAHVEVVSVNDPVEVRVGIADQSTHDGSDGFVLPTAGNFRDLDGEPLTYALDGNAPDWLRIDPATGEISVRGAVPADASQRSNIPGGAPGSYDVTVIARDAAGSEARDTFRLTVSNLAPVAVDDVSAGDEDAVQTGNVLGNDADGAPDGDALVVSAVNGASSLVGAPVALAHGTLWLEADGTWRFEPNARANALSAGETVEERVRYTVSDGEGGVAEAELVIRLEGRNDAPVVVDPAAPGVPGDPRPAGDPDGVLADVVTRDGAELLPVAAGAVFADADGEELRFAATGLPAGVRIDPATGEIRGVLAADASQGGPAGDGVYPVTVTATDPSGAEATTRFVIRVANVAPVAVDDGPVPLTEDVPAEGNLLANDVDGDGDELSVISLAVNGVGAARPGDPVEIPGVGVLTVESDGRWRFEPAADYAGPVPAVTYVVSDGQGGTDVAALHLGDVAPVNDGPRVVDPAGGTGPFDPARPLPEQEGTDGRPVTPVDVSRVFTDPDGDELRFAATGLPAGLEIDPVTGVISGVLAADASQGGPAGDGVYPVTVTATDPSGAEVTTRFVIRVANVAPVAVDDVSAGDEDTVQTGNVLGNDADGAPDGDALVVSAVNGASSLVGAPVALAHGTLWLEADGSWRFEPNARANALSAGETVEERVRYTVSDGEGGVAEAELVIRLEGRNDAPVVVDPAAPGVPGDPRPAGDPDGVLADVVTRDGAELLPVAAGAVFADADGEELRFAATGLPAGVRIDPATGEIRGVLAADASQGGPAGDGVYPVTVTATDPSGAEATTRFVIRVANVAPVAVDDGPVPLTEDVPAEGNLLANDVDGDGDELSVISLAVNGVGAARPGDPVEIPGVGVLTVESDGRWRFEPAADYAGPVPAVTYVVSDGQGGTDVAALHLGDVAPVNDGPRVVDPAGGTGPFDPARPLPEQEGTDGRPVTPVDVSRVFTDPDGDELRFAATGLPAGLEIDPVTGVISGVLAADASQGGPAGDGVYPVTVTATDPSGETRSIVLDWVVRNLPPVATAPIGDVTAINGGAVEILAGAHFADPDGDPLTYAAEGLPEGLTIDPRTGRISGSLPLDASAQGPWTVTVTADDGNGGRAQLTFVIAGEARTDITPEQFGQGGRAHDPTGSVLGPGDETRGSGNAGAGEGDGGDPVGPVSPELAGAGAPAGEGLLGTAVEALDPLGETALPGESGIVASVASNPAPASAAASLGPDGTIARVVRWAEAAAGRAFAGEGGVDADAGTKGTAGDYRGAELALQLEGNAGDVALRSLVAGDGLLAIAVATPDGRGAEAFRVREAGGGELPWNVRRADARTILVDIPAGREWVVLRIERLAGDRVSESWIVRVNTLSGEMQLLAHERPDRQAGLSGDLEKMAAGESTGEVAALLGALEVAS